MTKIITEQITSHDPDTFAQIDRLMPMLDQRFSGPDEDHFTTWFLNNPGRAMLVARMGNTVVGSATVNAGAEQAPESSYVELGGVITAPDARGQGVAQALIRHGMHWGRQLGIGRMVLNTEQDRPAAIRLYEKIGFVQTPGTVGHYEIAIPKIQIPDTVCAAYELANPVITPVQNGLVNQTFLVEDTGTTSILQRINDAFDPKLLEDSAVAATHLIQHGWEAPETLPTHTGELSCQDQTGGTWRRIRFIDSDPYNPAAVTHEQLYEVGSLLARWHGTMAQLDYEPQYAIPHFHDTPHFADRLDRYRFEGKFDPQMAQAAASLLAAYQDLPPLPTGNQLIHGDPQLSNVLLRDGKPVTYIDFDTIMRGSIWLDIGDLLRSVAEADGLDGRPLDIDKLTSIADGYRAQAAPDMNTDEFRRIAMRATKLIAIELAMRFYIDIVDDSYFTWDSSKFRNRRTNHLYRAGIQQQIVAAVEAYETAQTKQPDNEQERSGKARYSLLTGTSNLDFRPPTIDELHEIADAHDYNYWTADYGEGY